MSWRVLRDAACGLALCAITGCSLVKLSEEVVQARCDVHADCDVLDTESALDENPCLRWQCDPGTALCAYGKLDRDDDGRSPAEVTRDGRTFSCEPDRARQDCDDQDAQRTPGAPELCDGQDNDCDGHTDEAALQSISEPVLVLGQDAQATQAAYARELVSGTFAIGYSLLEGSTPRPGLRVLGPGRSASAEASSVLIEDRRPHGERVAVAALAGRFAYAFVDLRGSLRLIAGIAESDGARVAVDPALALTGVSCLRDERCLARAASAAEATEIPITAPALAALDERVLLAYLRWDGDPEPACASLAGAAGAQPELRANLLGVSDDGSVLQERSAGAVAIGSSADVAPPAVAGIGQIGSEAGPVGFVVAYTRGDGDVVLDRVQEVAASGAQNDTRRVLRVTQRGVLAISGGEPHAGVAMARGPGLAGIQVLGIAYQRGCGDDARVLVSLFRLRLNGDVLTAEAIAQNLEVGGGPEQRDPALAYSHAHHVWAVVYRDAHGLRARLIDPDGRLHGAGGEPYTLIANRAGDPETEVRVLLPPAVIPTSDADTWFAAAAHVLRADAPNQRAFELVRLGCGL